MVVGHFTVLLYGVKVDSESALHRSTIPFLMLTYLRLWNIPAGLLEYFEQSCCGLAIAQDQERMKRKKKKKSKKRKGGDTVRATQENESPEMKEDGPSMA